VSEARAKKTRLRLLPRTCIGNNEKFALFEAERPIEKKRVSSDYPSVFILCLMQLYVMQ
jgi:hypothetical protein